ncbi:hypothetical protein AVEN_22615-1 [Araneus ventricosus]|uniref:Cuticle protein 16.8 n=1 Tax=Araneus ventricosus TaxID=182803 RepID=A0A4Y2Q006_ARAVE|nr:hypothetical protein AVEN_22615-1 [Araneus ventricosus]
MAQLVMSMGKDFKMFEKRFSERWNRRGEAGPSSATKFQDERSHPEPQGRGDDYGNKKGFHTATRDEHGIYRQVEYIADAHGLGQWSRPNEPGTVNENPADVQIHSRSCQVLKTSSLKQLGKLIKVK